MRKRTTTAGVVLAGALALTAFAVPAAQADAGSRAAAVKAAAKAAKATQEGGTFAARSVKAAADEQYGDTAISNVVVNGGKDVVFGTSAKATVKVTFTAKDDSGIDSKSGYAVLYHGADLDRSDAGAIPSQDPGTSTTCRAASATTATCTLTFPMDPKLDLANFAAGSWKVWAIAAGNDGDYTVREKAKSFSVKRYAKLTTNAAPEPVKKRATLTVKGALTRANWDTGKYMGYTKQPVTLQFKKKGASAYSNVKKVTSDTKGNLKTTVKASVDGYWRYKFAGTSTTPAVTSKSDFVDVR